jgi:hypothetical protein
MEIIISDSDYKEIISELGYPIVKEEELEFSREDIQSLFIFPAMREFYIWFPIKSTQSVSSTGSFTIPFPDEYTYGVLDSRINTTASGANHTASPFMNELIYNSKVSDGGAYGTRNDYGFQEARYLRRAELRASADYSKSYKINVNEEARQVEGYSNVTGELVITWAKWSDNFNNIPFRRKGEVINLAKANVLKGFAMLRGQMSTDVGVEFDTAKFEDRARDLEEKIIEKWQGMTKVAIIRG